MAQSVAQGQLTLGFFLLASCTLPAPKRGCAGANAELCSGTQVSLSLIMLRHPSGVVLGLHEASKMMLWQQVPSAQPRVPLL